MTFSMNAAGRRAIAAVRKGYLPMVLVTLIALAFEVAVNIGVTQLAMSGAIDPGEDGRNLSWLSLAAINIVPWFHAVHTAALSEVAIRVDIGRPIDPGRILVASLKNSLPVLLLTALYAIGCLAGGVLLIVPGLYFATVFSVVVPVFVGERGDWISTFRRAFQLTQGHRWQIFAFWLVSMGACALTTLLRLAPSEVNQCPFDPGQRPAGCPGESGIVS